jgi:tetratricopeptide (TPR) repeat protein
MSRTYRRSLALVFPLFFGLQVLGAQATGGQERAKDRQPHVQETKSRAAGLSRVAPVPLLLFGAIPVSTRSLEARKLTELALDKYEGVMLDDAIVQAQHATEKDPGFALGYAVLAFASRRNIVNSAALARAKALLPRATADEQLMVRWMTSIQDRNLLPAIASMNDLLKRYPKNKHVLYLTSEWLYLQEDFERSQSMMESLVQLEPNFAPVLNMLGYSYIESGHPEPAKAVAALKRYAQLEPSSPNPEDSLGEVLRYGGDDESSLLHFGAALQIDPTFFSSQLGLGDTLTLMGKYDDARLEYDKAIKVSENKRDSLHASCQRALVYFWEGRAEEGRNALKALAEEAAEKKEPYGQFEAALASAMLAADYSSELQQLGALETLLQNGVDGMTGADRGGTMATVLCEEARIASRHGLHETAEQAISKLAQSAAQFGDLLVGNKYETARGYLLASQGDLATAADELSANRHSPLAVQQLALAQQKSGDGGAAAETLTQLKYQRAPSVEWFLVSHEGGVQR